MAGIAAAIAAARIGALSVEQNGWLGSMGITPAGCTLLQRSMHPGAARRAAAASLSNSWIAARSWWRHGARAWARRL
jgi:hypothetical protein